MSPDQQSPHYQSYQQQAQPDGHDAYRLSCSPRSLQYGIMGYGLFLLVVGIVVAAVGGRFSHSTTTMLTGNALSDAMIVCGVFIAVTGTLGIIGGKWKSLPVLCGFITFLIGWFLTVLVLSSYAISKNGSTDDAWSRMARAWVDLDNSARVRIQDEFNCCGAARYNDTFSGIPCPTLDNGLPVPASIRACINLLTPEYHDMWLTTGICGIFMSFILLCGVFPSYRLISVYRTFEPHMNGNNHDGN